VARDPSSSPCGGRRVGARAVVVLHGILSLCACTGSAGDAPVVGTGAVPTGNEPAVVIGSLGAVSVDAQTGTAGLPLADPLTVLARDLNGNPAVGVTVTWGVDYGGGSFQAETTLTDSTGAATNRWTLGWAGEQFGHAAAGDSWVFVRATAAPNPDYPEPGAPASNIVQPAQGATADGASVWVTVWADQWADAAEILIDGGSAAPMLDFGWTAAHRIFVVSLSIWEVPDGPHRLEAMASRTGVAGPLSDPLDIVVEHMPPITGVGAGCTDHTPGSCTVRGEVGLQPALAVLPDGTAVVAWPGGGLRQANLAVLGPAATEIDRTLPPADTIVLATLGAQAWYAGGRFVTVGSIDAAARQRTVAFDVSTSGDLALNGLAFHAGRPVVAYSDGLAPAWVHHLVEWDGSSWTELPDPGGPAGRQADSIAGRGGALVYAWADVTTLPPRMRIERLDAHGVAWSDISEGLPTAGTGPVAIDSKDRVHAAIADEVFVREGQSWRSLGHTCPTGATSIRLAIGADDQPVVVYLSTDGTALYWRRWTGTDWSSVVGPLHTTSKAGEFFYTVVLDGGPHSVVAWSTAELVKLPHGSWVSSYVASGVERINP
jgi:hypothetical protein